MTNKKILIPIIVLICGALIFFSVPFIMEIMTADKLARQKIIVENVRAHFAKLTIYGEGEKELPLFDIRNPQGEVVSLSSILSRDGFVLLNLWATWCPPCINELPSLQALSKEENKKGVKLFVKGLSLDQNVSHADLGGFLKRHQIGSFAHYQDHTNALIKTYSVPAMPTTLLVDNKGYVRAEFLGDADWTNSEIKAFLEDFVTISLESNKYKFLTNFWQS